MIKFAFYLFLTLESSQRSVEPRQTFAPNCFLQFVIIISVNNGNGKTETKSEDSMIFEAIYLNFIYKTMSMTPISELSHFLLSSFDDKITFKKPL